LDNLSEIINDVTETDYQQYIIPNYTHRNLNLNSFLNLTNSTYALFLKRFIKAFT
jgi:hypothetical protein